jgi:hypothetical protein
VSPRSGLKRLGAICGLALAALAGSCELFTFPLDEFHAEQTGRITLQAVPGVEGEVAEGSDGVICVAPGTTTITLPLDNPQGYDLDISFPADAPPPGFSVTARQSADKNAIEIAIERAVEGAEFTLPLTIKTAKGGRTLAVQELAIACVNFETRLAKLEVAGYELDTPFDPDLFVYAVDRVPVSAVTIRAEALNPQAVVSISGDRGQGDVVLTIGDNAVTVLVTVPHGADSREYGLTITRYAAGDSKAIAAFTIAGVTATAAGGGIDEAAGTIDVTVPYGTDLASLTPVVAHTGASYAPEGARDFSAPVVYTVTAANNTTKPYTVTVRPAASAGSKAITAFTVAGVTATAAAGIDEAAGTISVTVPYGTDLRSLTPAVIHTGAGYSPAGAQDFTIPVAYTVTAANNTTKSYTVTVRAAAPADITAFTLAGITVTQAGDPANGGIDEGTGAISVTVPYGTVLTSLIPIITHAAGASYSPMGARDFTGPVAYTVTAADGSAKTYTVTATPAALTSITAAALPDQTTAKIGDTPSPAGAVIQGTDSAGNTLDLTAGCDITISPNVAFSAPGEQSLTLTATHRASRLRAGRAYTVAVLDNAKTITAFRLPHGPPVSGTAEGAIDEGAAPPTITVTVPYGTDLARLTPVVAHTGAWYAPTGAQDFSNSAATPVTYTVTAEDGTSRAYTVTVTAALEYITLVKGPDTTAIKIGETLSLAGAVIQGTDSAGNTMDVTSGCVIDSYGDDFTWPGSRWVTVTHTASGLSDGFTATVLDNSKSIYRFDLPYAPPIQDGWRNPGWPGWPGLAAGDINEEAGTISVIVPYGTDITNLVPNIGCDWGASYVPEGAQDFSNSAATPVTYTVTAEDGTSRPYTVTVSHGPGVAAVITNAAIPELAFTPSSIAVNGGNVTVALSGGAIAAQWYVKTAGPVIETFSSPGSSDRFTFAAPSKPGVYNVSVIATVDTDAGRIDYAGNFYLTVE